MKGARFLDIRLVGELYVVFHQQPYTFLRIRILMNADK